MPEHVHREPMPAQGRRMEQGRDKPARRGPRAQALVVLRDVVPVARDASGLRDALLEDLRELLTAMGTPVSAQVSQADETLAALVRKGGNLLLAFSNVPALSPLILEGALDALRESDVVLGPCADGSVYLLGLSGSLDGAMRETLARIAVGRAEPLGEITDALCDGELEATVLPPWFRLARESDLAFADQLAQLSLLSEQGDEDFVADRLRLWFERGIEA